MDTIQFIPAYQPYPSSVCGLSPPSIHHQPLTSANPDHPSLIYQRWLSQPIPRSDSTTKFPPPIKDLKPKSHPSLRNTPPFIHDRFIPFSTSVNLCVDTKDRKRLFQNWCETVTLWKDNKITSKTTREQTQMFEQPTLSFRVEQTWM